MKKVFFLLLLPIFCFSQAVNNHVQKVSLPSPDAVALGKFGETPVDYFTGVPSISVPIYTIQAGPISLPIGLSQHSSGLRPAETPSWVGHGWVLNAGGMISRTVQGIEDEYTDGFLSQGRQTTFNGTCFSNSSKAQPINAMLSGDLDGEPDIFSYAVAGISGKFYLNASGTVVKIPENDLKITYTKGSSPSDFTNLSQFVITNTDGTQYIFGTNALNYKAIELSCVNQSSFKTASSWKLVRIVSADSQYYIDLNYTSEVYSYGNRDKNGTFGVSGYLYNKMEIEGHRLTSIVSSTGREVVTFVPSSNPREDVFGLISGSKTAYALDRIEIQHGNFCKKFQLGYQYTLDNTSAAASVDSENKKRLLLNSVQEKSCNDAISIPAYSFKYDISDNYLPHKLTAGTDGWAFYNGAENNKDFLYNIPYTKLEYFDGTNNIVAIEGGADKNAHFSFSKLGSLTKITYPTGGHSAFEYEANAVYDTVHHLDFTYFPQSASRSSCSNVYTDYDEFTATLTDVANTYFELDMANTGNQFFCCNDAFGSPLPKWVVFSIRQGSTQVFSNTTQLSCGQSTQLRGLLPNTLQNGVAYTFRVNPVNASGNLKLMRKSESITYENTEIGGIRIKKITHYDGIDTTNNIIKTYEYFDPVLTGRSSGILYNKPLYGFVKNFTTTCNPGLPSINFTTHFFFEFSPVPLSTFEGHQLCYKSVKESTPNAGFKRYNYFFVPYAGYQELPYAPPQPGISTGNLESESAYTPTSAIKAYSFNTQKSDALTYNNTDSSIFVKAYWGTNGGGGSPIGLYKIYNIGTKPFRLSSVENHKDGLTTTTSFLYRDDKEHLLPIRTKTTHPDGTLEKDTISYAKELNQTDLLSRHMIHLPLERQRFVNDGLTGGQKTNYSLFSSFPRPQTLQSYNTVSNIWETEATFNAYDSNGNPTSITNRGWQAETYAWDKDLLTQKTFQGFTWQYEYEANTSLLKKYTEPSALFTTYGYDALSRNTSINQYNGKTTTTLAYAYSTGTNKITVETQYGGSSTLKTEKEFDGLGRPTYTRKIGYGSGNQDVVTRVDYDNAGRVKNEYLPGFGSAGAYTSYIYEDSPLRRPTTITPPAPLGSSTLTYGNEDNKWTQTTTNALNEYKKRWTDTRGRMTKSTVGGSSITNTTTYEYDDRNNLLKVMPHGTSSTDANYIYSYTYNGRNLVTKKKLPEKNDINLNYDTRDLATHLQDGIQPVVYTEYDVYGRPTKTGFVPNTSSTSISNTLTQTDYKTTAGAGFGQPYKTMASLLDNTGAPTSNFITREITTFDGYHRPTNFKSNHPLNLANLEAITGETTFNKLDQITSLVTNVNVGGTTYSTTQNNTYQQGTRLQKRTFLFNNTTVTADEITSFNAFDSPLQTKIGGDLQTVDYSYYGNGFLQKINDGTLSNSTIDLTSNDVPDLNSVNDLFAMELNYATNGNISSWKTQNRGFAALTTTYSYDNLQRITSASNGTQQETFTYRDPLGNFNTIVRSDLVKSGGNWTSQSVDNLTFSYSNAKTNRISSIADASNNKLGYIPNNGAYSYDGNGNTTFDPSRGLTLTNNFLNLPSKFTKADGSKQEVIYDATGHKWQEKTYAANNGILLAQKTYLENMEFEGNELSLIHHPTGFVRKLNSANHLSGTQNGDAQGKTISSTQKIGDGRYTAIQQVTLLPGFEATAKDAFLAKIGTVNSYQWQYVLRDHLGNQRALFTDKNGDGLLQQSTDENSNEVLALRNYSAFGLELGGSNQNINYQNPYKYTGKEENSFTGYYDFGARWADPTIGNRFLSVDPLAEKYYSFSSVSYVNNNPIFFIDPDGKEIWISINENQRVRYENGQLYTEDGKKYKGNDRFVKTVTQYLNKMNSTEIGKIVLNELSKSEKDFSFVNESVKKDGKEIMAASFLGNESGGIIKVGVLMKKEAQESTSIDAVSHELFHAYQSINGETGATVNREVGAYLFGRAVAFSAGYGVSGLGRFNDAGKKYDAAMQSLLFSEKFNQQQYNLSLDFFKRGSVANSKGLYDNFSIKPNDKNPVIKKIFPLLR